MSCDHGVSVLCIVLRCSTACVALRTPTSFAFGCYRGPAGDLDARGCDEGCRQRGTSHAHTIGSCARICSPPAVRRNHLIYCDLCFRFAFFCLSTEHEQTHSLVRTRNHVTIHVECVVWTVRWCVARARRRIHALVTSARIWSHHTPHHASRHPTCPVRSSACPCSHACETSRVSLTVSYTCQPTVMTYACKLHTSSTVSVVA